MHHSRFAVVIPAHNASATLRSALHSVAQADRCGWDMQVIVVDDGSTDNTTEVAQRAASDYGLSARVLRNDQAKGVGLARKMAIDAADADVIMQVDADDLVRENRFKDALAVLADPDVMVTAGNLMPFTESLHRPGPAVVLPTCSQDVAASLLFYNPTWGGVTSFKTRLLKTFEMPQDAYGEDWSLVHRLVRDHGAQSVRNSGTILADYRRHPGQATDRPDAYLEAIMPLWSQILWESLRLRPEADTFALHCRCAPYAFRETALLNDSQWQQWIRWAEQMQAAAVRLDRVPQALVLQIRLAKARLAMRRQEHRDLHGLQAELSS